MAPPHISLLAAVTRDGGIGRDGGLVARIADDLRRFKQATMGAPIVMGRKTWQSIGRALPGRRSIVVTRQPGWHAEGAEAAPSLDAALALAGAAPRVFVIGGAEIFALALPLADELLLTEIDTELPADAYFPQWDRSRFERTAHEPHNTADGVPYAFATYRRIAKGDDDHV